MSKPNFNAKRKHIASQHRINADIEQVFPLLCPTREFDWIEKWDCEVIYSQSGLAELGCIFSTSNSDGGGKDIWLISHYEKNQRIQFVRVNSIRSIRYELTLSHTGNKTDILWQQEITALNEQGNEFIEMVKQSDFDKQIEMLGELLNYYIENGNAKYMS